MIYLYGDLHRHVDLETLVQQSKNCTNKDILIILGDFGGIWYGDEKDVEWIKKFEELLPFKEILFLDGNHENFEALNNLPTEYKYGSVVGKAGNRTYHLQRAQKFTIEEKTFFVMGGASSIDRYRRIENVNWWREELPSMYEIEKALDILEENKYEFDYILTHCTAGVIQKSISKHFDKFDTLTKFFDMILPYLKYKHWYFGHYHLNSYLKEYNATSTYCTLIPLENSSR